MMGDMGGMMGAGWMTSFMWLNLLIGFGLLALIVLGVIAGVWWLMKSSGFRNGSRPADPALEILRERYARGEISRDEFERMRRDLS